MSTISSPGIGSGIDVQTIVSQLVALEKAPLAQLEKAGKSARAVYVHDLIHRIKLLGNLAWYATDAKGQVSAFLQRDAAVAYAGANKGKVFDFAGLRAGVTGR